MNKGFSFSVETEKEGKRFDIECEAEWIGIKDPSATTVDRKIVMKKERKRENIQPQMLIIPNPA